MPTRLHMAPDYFSIYIKASILFPLLNTPITSRGFPRTDVLPHLVLTVRFRACKRLNDFPGLGTYGLCTVSKLGNSAQ